MQTEFNETSKRDHNNPGLPKGRGARGTAGLQGKGQKDYPKTKRVLELWPLVKGYGQPLVT